MTGADGLPKPLDGGNVLRPSTTLKFSLRLPPDVDAQAASDAVISAITTDEGAHVTIDMEAAAQGWVAEPLREDIAALGTGSPTSGSTATPAPWAKAARSPSWPICTGFPGTQFVATGVLGPGSNAHGPNESLHIPMGKAVTQLVAELVAADL